MPAAHAQLIWSTVDTGSRSESIFESRESLLYEKTMLAKVTSKNQLTLPKTITAAVGEAEYYDVEARDGQIVLTPVRIQRGDAVRDKLAALKLTEADVTKAVAWARRGT